MEFHFKFPAMALLFQVSLTFHSACHAISNGDKFVRMYGRRIVKHCFSEKEWFLHSETAFKVCATLFAVPLNFLNKPLFRVWPTRY